MPVGVREEVRIYKLLTGPQGKSRAVLQAALASLLANNPEQWRQLAHCFNESFQIEPSHRRLSPLRAALESLPARLTPALRTTLVMALVLLCLGSAVYRLWPRNSPPPHLVPEEQFTKPIAAPPPTARIVEDKPAEVVEQRSVELVAIPQRPWVLICALAAALVALGMRWLLLPRALRRWQFQSQREAEAALAREARRRGQMLRPSYRVEPILPIARSAAEDCATLLGRLTDKDHGVELDVPRTLDATVRAGGQFTAVLLPRLASCEVLLLIDDEGRDHPWLSTIKTLTDLWRRQGVRTSTYTYGGEFPQFLDLHPRTHHHSIALADAARQHAGAALLIFSRRLSVDGFEGESDWTKELESFPRRAWVDPDPRHISELPKARARNIARLAEHRLTRFPLTDAGVTAAVWGLANEHEATRAGERPWPVLSACRSPREQRALRLWATAAALVPDATWDQVLALRVALPEINEVFPVPDVRYVQRLLEWVKRESGEDPEKHVDRLFLPPELHDWLIQELRRDDGGPTRQGCFEHRVHQILLGQLGDAPRAADQQDGRGRLIWELKVAMHKALLSPERAQELLGHFVGTGVESLLGVFLRGERMRQVGQPLFSVTAWANLGAMVAQEGRVAPRDLFVGSFRLWLWALGSALGLFVLLCLPVLVTISKLSERMQPQVTRLTKREVPAESHVERLPPSTVKTDEGVQPPTPVAPPEKPSREKNFRD